MRGVNHRNMNEKNKFLLLKTIVTKGPISRIALSELFGLSKMTITSIVGEFIEKGIVEESGAVGNSVGRKATLLKIVPDSLLTLGVFIGRDSIEVGVLQLDGTVSFSTHVPISAINSVPALISSITLCCEDCINRVKDKEKIWGISIASIGPIDLEKGTILSPPDFKKLKNIEIVSALKAKFDYPVYIGNDMDVSALAELYFGCGTNTDCFVYMGISSGIGGGLVLNHHLYTGTRGLASELGHMIVEPDGILCDCGNKGCFERYSSIRACISYAKELGACGDLNWLVLLERANNGDEICLKAIDRMYKYIESVAINLINMLDISCIVLGGDIYYGAHFFVDKLKSAVNKNRIASELGDEISVHVSRFSAPTPFIGTVALVMENSFNM